MEKKGRKFKISFKRASLVVFGGFFFLVVGLVLVWFVLGGVFDFSLGGVFCLFL